MEATTVDKNTKSKTLTLYYKDKGLEVLQVLNDVIVTRDSIIFLEIIDSVSQIRSIWYSLDGLESFTYEGDLKYLASDKTIKISPNM